MCIKQAQAVYDLRHPADELAYREDQSSSDWATRDILKGKPRYRFTVESVQSADDLANYVYENIDDEHYYNFIDSGSEFPCLQ